MKIQSKITILILVVFVLIGTIISYYISNERSRILLLFQEESKEREKILDSILKLKQASLNAFVTDYTFWDDMVNFVKSGDPKWAAENIEASFTTYKADAAWVYRMDLGRVYTINSLNAPEELADVPVIPLQDIEKIFKEKRICHFFANTKLGVMEIFGATVHPTADKDRLTPPQGYFFAAKLWNSVYLDELSEVLGGKATLAPCAHFGGKLGKAFLKVHTIALSKEVFSWDGRALADIHIEIISPIIQSYELFSRKTAIFLVIYFLIIFGIIPFYINYFISRPLGFISRTLRTADSSFLKKLEGKKDEFGDISRLIVNFFKQEAKIIEEISERERIAVNLEKSQRMFKLLAENISDVIWTMDMNLKFTYFTPSVKNISGYTVEEALALSLDRVFTPASLAVAMKAFTEEMMIEKMPNKDLSRTRTIEGQQFRKDGFIIWVEYKASFLRDAQGKAIGFVGIIRDISERKKMQEELKARVDELEKFYKISIGREEKMIELKKRIAELEEKLKEKA